MTANRLHHQISDTSLLVQRYTTQNWKLKSLVFHWTLTTCQKCFKKLLHISGLHIL